MLSKKILPEEDQMIESYLPVANSLQSAGCFLQDLQELMCKLWGKVKN